MRSYRQLTAESLETRQLLAAVDFTAHDQLMLELVNRARMAPLEEAQRYGIDLNEGFDEGTISSEPTQPLAPNQILTDASLPFLAMFSGQSYSPRISATV